MAFARDASDDFVLPLLDVRAVIRRAGLAIALVAVAVASLVIAGGPARAFADALGRALDADPGWVVAAAGFELFSFGGYILLLWLVAGQATPRFGLRTSAQVALGGAAATRLLPTGGVGGVALTLWALQRSGLGSRGATRTLLAFLVLLYSVFLAALAVTGALVAVGLAGAQGPLVLSAIPAAGAALAIGLRSPVAAQAETTSPPSPKRVARVHARLLGGRGVLGAAVRDALVLVRFADPRLLGALAWWALDAAVLWAMFHALGAPPPLAIIVLGYLVGQVANTLPVPGAVSGGMVGVLLAFGVQPNLALASVLAYRAVAIWAPAPVGVASLSGLRRTVARWRSDSTSPHIWAHATPARLRAAAPVSARRCPERAVPEAA